MIDDKNKDLKNQTKVEKSETPNSLKITNSGAKAEVLDKPSTGSVVAGAIAIALAIFLTVLALISISKPTSPFTFGEIEGGGSAKMGQNQTYTYQTGDIEIREGTDIVWLVDDVEVERTTYHKGDEIKFDFSHSKHGKSNIKVNVGNHFMQTLDVEVEKPVVNLSVPEITIVYGDEIPKIDFCCEGLLQGDNIDCLNFDGCVEIEGYSGEGQRLAVGVYKLKLSKEVSCDNYDAKYTNGSLIVLPRQVTLHGNFSKTYDGTNVLSGATVRVEGVLDGDEVEAVADQLYFENKSVGTNKTLSTLNVNLAGNDASNYVLNKEGSHVCGSIVPKKLTLQNTKVHSKMFDGTTAATFENIGTLVGVVESDVVALGGLKAEFESASAGKNKTVKISGIYLVGGDKANYTIDSSIDVTADITNNYLDILLNKPQILGSAK